MTPERLDYIEDCARRTHWLDDGDGKRTLVEASREDVRDLCAEIRRLTAERDEANERIRDLEKSVARLVERANRQRDRIGRAHDLLSGVDADV